MTTLIERVDEFGRPAWIALMVLSFIMCWPVGLIILGFLIGSGRMGCWSHNHGGDRWQRRADRMQRGIDRMQDGLQRMQAAAERFRGSFQQRPGYQPSPGQPSSSGNWAFDEYRAETLRRLEDEQREFREFLDRLRHAKDKSEFDQFMADRRRQADDPPPPPPQY
jgi:Protein of unknown function (DUF2852)